MGLLTAVAVAVMLAGAVMIFAGYGDGGVWIAAITAGIAMVAIIRTRHGKPRLGA